MRRNSLLPLSLALALLLGGTAEAARVVSATAEDFDPVRPARVALVPPLAVPSPPGAGWVSCPIGGEAFVPCEVADAAESELSRALAGALTGVPNLVLVPPAEVNAALARLKEKNPGGLSLAGGWQAELAREAGADYALTGFIFCWRDRSGSAWASTRPAAVGFCLHLLETDSGRMAWRLRYEDEQKALLDDLLGLRQFVRRGGRWISSAEMAVEAAAEARRLLPWSRP